MSRKETPLRSIFDVLFPSSQGDSTVCECGVDNDHPMEQALDKLARRRNVRLSNQMMTSIAGDVQKLRSGSTSEFVRAFENICMHTKSILCTSLTVYLIVGDELSTDATLQIINPGAQLYIVCQRKKTSLCMYGTKDVSRNQVNFVFEGLLTNHT